MPDHSESPPEHPAARIRSRIKERRVLEARFLFRQFSEEIGARDRQALEEELSRLLAEVDRLRHLAREAAAGGRREEAVRLYRDIEQVAVDVPGLAEEQRSLAGADAIFSRIAARGAPGGGPAPVIAATPQPVAHQEAGENEAVPPPVGPGREAAPSTIATWFQCLPRKWLVAGCLALVLLVLVIWRGGTNEPVSGPSPVAESAQETPARPAVSSPPPTIESSHDPQAGPAVSISPIRTDQSAPLHPSPDAAGQSAAQPPEPEPVVAASAETVAPPATPDDSRSIRVKLGALQVEESGKQ